MVLGFFALLEGGLRVYVAVRNETLKDRSLPPSDLREAYQQPDPVFGYALRPGHEEQGIRINALGFRGPEILRTKPPGMVRIVAMGDSTTFGLSRAPCTYPAALSRRLKLTAPSPVEVVNAGVEGYSSLYLLHQMQERVAPLSPDVVLIYAGWNDLYSPDALSARGLSRNPTPTTPSDRRGSLPTVLNRLCTSPSSFDGSSISNCPRSRPG